MDIYSSSETWGTYGWTYADLEAAKVKFDQLFRTAPSESVDVILQERVLRVARGS